MKTTRKRYRGEFKAKVALEAIRGDLVRRQNNWRNSRRRLAECGPRLWLEVGNEILDYISNGGWTNDTLSDFAWTIFWPLVISLCVRLKPAVGRSASPGCEA